MWKGNERRRGKRSSSRGRNYFYAGPIFSSILSLSLGIARTRVIIVLRRESERPIHFSKRDFGDFFCLVLSLFELGIETIFGVVKVRGGEEKDREIDSRGCVACGKKLNYPHFGGKREVRRKIRISFPLEKCHAHENVKRAVSLVSDMKNNRDQ